MAGAAPASAERPGPGRVPSGPRLDRPPRHADHEIVAAANLSYAQHDIQQPVGRFTNRLQPAHETVILHRYSGDKRRKRSLSFLKSPPQCPAAVLPVHFSRTPAPRAPEPASTPHKQSGLFHWKSPDCLWGCIARGNATRLIRSTSLPGLRKQTVRVRFPARARLTRRPPRNSRHCSGTPRQTGDRSQAQSRQPVRVGPLPG